jgi:predicted acetyltransferase
MNVREATLNDASEIVELLQLSLGNTRFPKTIDYWKWKHYKNPFGESKIIVAEEKGRIVGVRAFLRWQWIYNSTIINALRAVDTATHPKYRRRGVFRNLTTSLRDKVSHENFKFIYNTPNKISGDGYLNMGWKLVGRIPVLTIFRLKNISFQNSGRSIPSRYQQEDVFLRFIAEFENDTNAGLPMFTNRSPKYWRWRYRDCPAYKYYYIANDAYFFCVRIVKHKGFNELRIVDCLTRNGIDSAKEIMKEINNFCSISNCILVTHSDWDISNVDIFRQTFKFIFKKSTPFFALNFLDKSFGHLAPGKNWNLSLGDLELF